ncbi:hypothetical protein ACFVZA_29755 [Streptomyces bottropensis]|uniref:hypothetical protein n=1 Tax=Streptomyces bottropensis TaxID=42235 RepID=UPI0036A64847
MHGRLGTIRPAAWPSIAAQQRASEPPVSTLRPPTGICEPPWCHKGIDGCLPAPETSGGENTTEPISPDTMAPCCSEPCRAALDADTTAASDTVSAPRYGGHHYGGFGTAQRCRDFHRSKAPTDPTHDERDAPLGHA